MLRKLCISAILAALLIVVGAPAALAGDGCAPCAPAPCAPAPYDPCAPCKKKEPGELPNGKISITKLAPPVTRVFDYAGEFWKRGTLVGDPCGVRSKAYCRGFTFDVTLTQVLQGVTSGGSASGTGGARYNGLLEINATMDTAKAGLWSGGLFAATMMSSFGKPLSSEPGNLSPVNMTPMWPIPFQNSTELTEYYLMQGLPHEMVLLIGRLDATNFLDKNTFANNPESQFLNVSLNNELLWGAFLSFSTYAAMLVAPINEHVTLAGAVWDPETQPGDYGGVWDNYGVAVQANLSWKLCGLKGVFSPALAYVSKDATAFDNPRLVPDIIAGDAPTKSGNWMFQCVGEQFLWTPRGASVPMAKGGRKECYAVPTQDFVANAPGVGLFYRFAYTPEDRNPWNVGLSGGFGARGVIPHRPYDRMGVGAYWMSASDDMNAHPVINHILEDEVGLEAFYNFAITPAVQISADVQWVSSGLRSSEDVVVLGTRLFIRF